MKLPILITLFLLMSPAFTLADIIKGPARVVDGDTIIVNTHIIQLDGIDAPEIGQKCNLLNGNQWDCGNQAAIFLKRVIGRYDVTCHHSYKNDLGRFVSTCRSREGFFQVNATMVRSGHAWAYGKHSWKYTNEEKRAKETQVGIWRANTQTAAQYRAQKWSIAVKKAPKQCPIKGDISLDKRLYYLPWQQKYKDITIEMHTDEQWFCSEKEAIEAGWKMFIEKQ